MHITHFRLWAITLLFFFPFLLGAQIIIYVDQNATGGNNGSSWQNAYTELRVALATATCGTATEFRIAQGNYLPTSSTNRNVSFTLCNNWHLIGGYPTGGGSINPLNFPTVLSGDIGVANNIADNSYHVVNIVNADATLHLENLQIKFGNANGTGENDKGGGIYLVGSGQSNIAQPQFTSCIFRDNQATNGGAVYHIGNVSARFADCFFNNNQADTGGAVYNVANGDDNCSPVFLDCFFFKNTAQFNGGAVNEESNNLGKIGTIYSSCTFEGNQAVQSNGGAMANRGNNGDFSYTVDRCRFLSNLAGNGGGAVFAFAPRSSFTNSEFIDNQADEGGAFHVLDVTPGFSVLSLNNTFYANEDTAGGAVVFYKQNNGAIQTGADFINCILWANTSIGTTDGNVNITTDHINISNSIIEGGWPGGGANNMTSNPQFVNAPDNLQLQDTSPAIDQGNPNVAVFADFQGKPRPQGNGLDIGAHEFGLFTSDNLAVDWVRFTATITNSQTVQLDWSTANEKEVATFQIERSTDGENFTAIGEVKPFNTATARYQFMDNQPQVGSNFYRIAQRDFSGKTTHSAMQSVVVNRQQQVVIYPNPTNDGRVQIKGLANASLHVEIFNTQQQLILQTNDLASVRLIHSGVYFIKVYDGERLIRVEKVVRL